MIDHDKKPSMIYELRKITNTWDGIRTTPLEVGKKSPISGGLKMRYFPIFKKLFCDSSIAIKPKQAMGQGG